MAGVQFASRTIWVIVLPFAVLLAGVVAESAVAADDAWSSPPAMRAFVRLRQMIASHADLARKLDVLERKYDAQFKVVFDAIRQLMAPPAKKKTPIGFHAKHEK